MKVWTSPALMLMEEAKVGPLYGMREPVKDRRHGWKTYFGALRGFLPVTTHRRPPPLHLLQTFWFFGKSHFIWGGANSRVCRQSKLT